MPKPPRYQPILSNQWPLLLDKHGFLTHENKNETWKKSLINRGLPILSRKSESIFQSSDSLCDRSYHSSQFGNTKSGNRSDQLYRSHPSSDMARFVPCGSRIICSHIFISPRLGESNNTDCWCVVLNDSEWTVVYLRREACIYLSLTTSITSWLLKNTIW